MDKGDWKKVREDAEALRDEVKVQLRLAGMEARSAFDRLEKEGEQLKRKLDGDLKRAWSDLRDGFKQLLDQIRPQAH